METISLFASEEHPTKNHPNLHKFLGCLTLFDTVSDKPPSGARGHKVIVTKSAVEKALPSLLCMAIDYKAGWEGHDARQKCGIITNAYIEENRVMVNGYIYKRDFPEIAISIKEKDIGMSYEIVDAHVINMRSAIWTIDKLTFTGAAILLREKAAYINTGLIIE